MTLATENSTRTFKIHKTLLESKSQGLYGRLKNFKEGAETIYLFHDTSENTLVRFVEWAYRGDYPETIQNVGPTSTHVLLSSSADEGITAGDGPLNCHMQMYVFAHVYGISRLESMAFGRITTCLEEISIPKNEKVKMEVIYVMEMGFRKIFRDDRLLNWLGHYASFCLSELKETPAFQELLEETPSLSLAMLKHLNPASSAPWPRDSMSTNASFCGPRALERLSPLPTCARGSGLASAASQYSTPTSASSFAFRTQQKRSPSQISTGNPVPVPTLRPQNVFTGSFGATTSYENTMDFGITTSGRPASWW